MPKKGKKKQRIPAGLTVRWAQYPATHDYPAAESYLRLVVPPDVAHSASRTLAQVPTTQQHVKDVLRAARLALLPAKDPEVAKDLDKIIRGEALSPVLLVRGDAAAGLPLQVADGYHRICASYHVDEDTEIPCRLADLPTAVRSADSPA